MILASNKWQVEFVSFLSVVSFLKSSLQRLMHSLWDLAQRKWIDFLLEVRTFIVCSFIFLTAIGYLGAGEVVFCIESSEANIQC